MPDPDVTTEPMPIAEVSAEDREAYLSMSMLPEFDAADVRAGRWDKVTGLQAFARHRLTALADAERKLEEARGALPDEIDLYRTIKTAPVKTHIGIARHIIATHWPLAAQDGGKG